MKSNWGVVVGGIMPMVISPARAIPEATKAIKRGKYLKSASYAASYGYVGKRKGQCFTKAKDRGYISKRRVKKYFNKIMMAEIDHALDVWEKEKC